MHPKCKSALLQYKANCSRLLSSRLLALRDLPERQEVEVQRLLSDEVRESQHSYLVRKRNQRRMARLLGSVVIGSIW